MERSDATTVELVLQLLCRQSDPVTPSGISEELPRTSRSVRAALRELERRGCVSWRLDPTDPRRRLYTLNTPGDDETEAPEGEANPSHTPTCTRGDAP